MASIYDHSETYDLEHSGKQEDIDFFVALVERLKPHRILELACGNGRLTLPLAEESALWGGAVTGIDSNESMLSAARKRSGTVEWISADLRSWRAPAPFDLIISACSSLSHLLTVEDQIAAWRTAHANLVGGGRFVVAEQMPDYGVLAESMRIPARASLTFDGDFQSEGVRLVRQRAINYRSDLQRMHVRYFYDRIENEKAERFVNDYNGHVYFPNELKLLFLTSGFTGEDVKGDYDGTSFQHSSRVMIICGRREEA